MKKLEDFYVFETEQSWAQALADTLMERLRGLLQQQEQVVLAVSGGQSPKALFALLNQADLDWQRVVIQLVDERLLSRGHTDSNSQLIDECLHQNRAQAATWQPLLPVTEQPARQLNEQERAQVLQDALAQYAQPDIVILGMGEDAHTASLFPDAAQLASGLAEDAADLLLVEPPVAPYWRLSMSLPAILRAQSIYIAAWGESKRAVLAQALVQKSDAMPISHVLHSVQESQLDVYC